jgi:hypothetical protein
MVALTVLIAFLGLAIIKPWGAQVSPKIAQVSIPVMLGPVLVTPPPSRSSPPSRPVAAGRTVPSAALSAELHDTTVHRDAWGISVVVVPAGMQRFDGGGPGLAERWMPIDVAHGAAWNMARRGTAESSGDAVLAIGATMPADITPLDVRFWRLDDADEPREIAPVPVDSPDQGMQLWLPDPANSTAIGTWPSGTYLINVTIRERVVHLVMIVRGDVSTI